MHWHSRCCADGSGTQKPGWSLQNRHWFLKQYLLAFICLVPRRLSLDENVRAKEGGKETTGETSLRPPSVPFPWSLAVHHQSLAFRAPLYLEKNEAPEKEAVLL